MTTLDLPPTDAPPTPWHPVAPYRIADDTFVTGTLYQAPGAPVGVHLNSMIIRGAEPVLVDTGAAATSAQWLEDTWSIVDPADVKWVFLTHEEPDHAGNVRAVLDACPNATLVTSWFALERLAALHPVPLHRVRWLNDGESFHVGDRTLHAITPPVYDAPTTRGLFDDRTGVYWAADAFGAPVPEAMTDADDLPAAAWEEGFLGFARMVAPWHRLLSPDRFDQEVGRVARLRPSVVASGHGPAVRGPRLEQAFTLIRTLPDMPAAPLPGQHDLEQILLAAGM